MSYQYDHQFMDYANRSSEYSAHQIAKTIQSTLRLKSALDVGCATGTWLHAWSALGVQHCHGVDGSYVKPDTLRVPQEWFTPVDLSRPLDLGRTFELVQSLEVGEHIPAEATDVFIDNIVKHSNRLVLFSAAPPGQGGEFHINEQPFDFWRTHFARRGFVPFDWIRPMIANDTRISFWYRYNLFLYVRRDAVATLPPEVRATEIPDGHPMTDVSPRSFKIRKAILRQLPRPMQDRLAQLKVRLIPPGRF